MTGYLILIGLWVMYGIIHSIFASTWMKSLFQEYSREWYRYYRITYSVLAVLLLIPILWYQSTLVKKLFFEPNPWSIFTGLCIASFGLLIIKISFGHYDLKEFLGFRQLSGDFRVQPMKREGMLSMVRHPLYSGSILAILGYFIFAPTITNLITALCLITYFIVGLYFEEKKLIREFGDKYRSYQRQVPALFPATKNIFKRDENSKKNK
jgi:protein-S-isoprenylcysteine O-methyltransferase Ste14